MQLVRSLALLALAALGCRETHPTPARIPRDVSAAAPIDATVPSMDASLSLDAATSGESDLRAWPFVEHARRYCLPDRLARTAYLEKWAPLFHGRLAPGEPVPERHRELPRASGEDPPSLDDQQRILTWQSQPRVSHVMDCALPVPDESRADRVLRTTSYSIYLPADYLDHPRRARPILMLVSGGNGNRTRWFLTPSSTTGMIPGTGGLEVRSRVDAWAAAHPGEAPPIVVGLDGSSEQFPNGMWAFIGRELPEHLLATYLPGHARASIAIGIESISSGAVEVVHALRADPAAFNTVGFLSPYVHPNGVNLSSAFGSATARRQLFLEFARRHREGVFAMRFSIGLLDDHYPRTWAWYQLLCDAGLFARAEHPTLDRCSPAARHQNADTCWSVWPGFYGVPHECHNYRALLPTFGPQFEWELETLTAIQRRLADGRTGVADAGVTVDAR